MRRLNGIARVIAGFLLAVTATDHLARLRVG
jgi:hypothetical protein